MLARTRGFSAAGGCLAGIFLIPACIGAQSIPEWRLSAEVRIGEDQSFTRITAILPRPDGSIVVADNRNREIHVFRRDGTHINSIGRTGQGPGEYAGIRSIGMLGDTLWIIHSGEPMASFFAIDGTFLSSVRRDARVPITAMMPDGALGIVPRGPDALPRNEPVPLLRVTRSGQTLDTLAWVRTDNHYFWLGPRQDGSYTIGPQPFQDPDIVIVAMDAPTFFIIDRTVAKDPAGAAIGITALRSDGDTLWDRDYAYTPKRVAKARIDSILDAREPTLVRAGFNESEIRNALFLPEYHPPVTSAFTGLDGSLWLRRDESGPTVEYWVVDSSGRLAAMLTVPSTLTLMAATASEAWGFELDEFDVPTVIRNRIHR